MQLTGRDVARLRRWAIRRGRAFPWRSRSGFDLAVAEVLLQKTRGDAVVPVWTAVVARYPTPAKLARARERTVQRLVSPLGLGEQRARRLVSMARDWGGVDRGEPVRGLGPYGLAIVQLSLGLRPSIAPVDGNIARVVTRFHGFHYERGEPRKKPEVREAVHSLIARRRPERALQLVLALVDIGATICAPQSPACPECPLRRSCVFAATSDS